MDKIHSDIESTPNQLGGLKFDTAKPRPDLLHFQYLMEVSEILEYGARKYSADNWKKVEPYKYIAAMFRHLFAWAGGEMNDKDTGKSHLAHATCCIMFLYHFDKEKVKND